MFNNDKPLNILKNKQAIQTIESLKDIDDQTQEDLKKKKFFALIEFPYPSGAGMHVGHIRSNTAMDIISRKRRREGFNPHADPSPLPFLLEIRYPAYLSSDAYMVCIGRDN